MDNLTFRLIKENDYLKGCLKLYEQFYNIDPLKIDYYEFREYVEKQNSNNYNIFVCEINEKIIACASCFIENKLIHNFGKVAHIEDVVIDMNYRSLGIGKKIINHCVQHAKDKNCYKIILDCSNDLVNYYKKIGFESKGQFMAIYFKN